MRRMALIEPDRADDRASELLHKTKAQLGRLPNLYKAMANAPVVLDGYLKFRAALIDGKLDKFMLERIALLTAEENACHYCVSAHMFRGEKIGMTADDLADTREARSQDKKIEAALALVREAVSNSGFISDTRLDEARSAGWSDGEIGEMIGHVALNTLSNYFSHLAEPELDFPQAPARKYR